MDLWSHEIAEARKSLRIVIPALRVVVYDGMFYQCDFIKCCRWVEERKRSNVEERKRSNGWD